MSHFPQAPAEEAHCNPQAIVQMQHQCLQAPTLKLSTSSASPPTLDLSELEKAASNSSWMRSQHQADAFVALTGDWLRAGEPHLAPDPKARRVLDRFAAHHVAWNGALARAIANTPPGYDLECLQQVVEAIAVAAKVGETLGRQSPEQTQRTEKLAHLLTPESQAPFAYFRRTSPRAPFTQCRATDEGGVPLYVDPHAVLDPVIVPPSPVKRFRTQVNQTLQAWSRCCAYVRQAAYNTWYPYTGDDDEQDRFA